MGRGKEREETILNIAENYLARDCREAERDFAPIGRSDIAHTTIDVSNHDVEEIVSRIFFTINMFIQRIKAKASSSVTKKKTNKSACLRKKGAGCINRAKRRGLAIKRLSFMIDEDLYFKWMDHKHLMFQKGAPITMQGLCEQLVKDTVDGKLA